jgi:hypothetical protein
MSSISIRGIVLGSLFDLAMTFGFSIILVIAVAVSNGGDPQGAIIAANSGHWLLLNTVVASAFTVVAGYLAARIAGRGELINGTLCTLLSMGVCLLLSAGQPSPFSATPTLILYAITPLLGLLGGYMRLRQVTELA